MAVKVELFSEFNSSDELQRKVNNFLANLPNESVIDIKLSSSGSEDDKSNRYTDIMVIYKD
ncbi:hypothetical protein PAECIP111891_06737 [Paenibacillus allorhizoplanae]|uniref:Sporulation protein Cse60 n=1 Tax=Paenibacillus allorhizoplanae TaxID=2905648 RepID=A0ABM9D083_9BACL|nr:sporulation protein Cse60 [Paenibacillus allorhizoplanae]CAH1230730.1 hypothetical protein PAECIP111891_06737 [Paenibacillus allorhizoplanae]